MAIEGPEQELRWRRRKHARPAEILAAALDCFAERGFAATRLDEVARRAGVTKGTLYLYFYNKEELFKAVVRQALLPNIAHLEAVVAETDVPAPALLEQLLSAWFEIVNSPVSAIPKIVLAEAGNFPELARFYLDEVVHRGMALVRRVLRAGVERGEFCEMDVESTAMCVVAPFILAALWRHSLGRQEPRLFEPAALGAAQLRLLSRGLAADDRSAAEASA
jgi:AcrR family transcriptional regulator